MPDEADMGNDKAERMLEASIAEARYKALRPIKPTGLCMNCEEPVPQQLFCSAECRDDYERRVRRATGK